MSSDYTDAIQSIYAAAVDRAHAGRAVSRNLRRLDDSTLEIAGATVAVKPNGVYVIAFGKAALGMSAAAVSVLDDLLGAGIAVTKDECGERPERVTVLRSSHPIPDQSSVDAGEAILTFARKIPNGATVICLISGGGSALVEAPCDGVTLSELRRMTSHLLSAGASIQEMNAVRSCLSRVKAGGLLRELRHTRVHNLVVSDVLGDNLQAIASGPTVPPLSGVDPETVLTAYGLNATLPSREAGSALRAPHTAVIANVSMAIDAAAERAAALGFMPFVITRSLDGEARETGRLFGSIVKDSEGGRTSLPAGTCLIAGGETVVTLSGQGVGGRNTEAALAAALALRESATSAIGFLSTDGDDGVSGAAGAIVDGSTVPEAEVAQARAALKENDSYTYLHRVGATLTTGPTGTNVNDLVIAIVGN